MGNHVSGKRLGGFVVVGERGCDAESSMDEEEEEEEEVEEEEKEGCQAAVEEVYGFRSHRGCTACFCVVV